MSISQGSTTGNLIIHHFNASINPVKRGESFTLSWNVEGADKIELYRNGALFQTLGGLQTSIDRTEFYDSENEVRYELVAHRQGRQVRSKPVTIKFNAPSYSSGGAATITNSDTTKLLVRSAMWAKFIAICGIVLLSLFVLIALIMNVTRVNDAFGTSVFAAIMVAVFLAPAIMLLSFANHTNRSMERSNGSDLVSSFRYLKFFFQVVGITLIILMFITLILFFTSK
ncbi:MAG TPA: hypothetical protein VF487_13400 [Chitinophagaceae bacterium]